MQRARRIAIYMAVNGEVNCQPLIDQAWLRKKQLFAPILAQNRLFFAPLERDGHLTKNRFRIPEPTHAIQQRIHPRELDIVIVPLTSFDSDGNRLGMGAGYYDRTFAFRKRCLHWRRPLLIGVAYSFQRTSQLQSQSWDVPLDIVITEQEGFGKY